jgi:hypothetical protein
MERTPTTFEECQAALKACPRNNVALRKKLMKLRGTLPRSGRAASTTSAAAAPPPPPPFAVPPLLRQDTSEVMADFEELPGATAEAAALARTYVDRARRLGAAAHEPPAVEQIKSLVREGQLGAAGRELLARQGVVDEGKTESPIGGSGGGGDDGGRGAGGNGACPVCLEVFPDAGDLGLARCTQGHPIHIHCLMEMLVSGYVLYCMHTHLRTQIRTLNPASWPLRGDHLEPEVRWSQNVPSLTRFAPSPFAAPLHTSFPRSPLQE